MLYGNIIMSLTYIAKILNIKSIKIIPGKSHLAVKKKENITHNINWTMISRAKNKVNWLMCKLCLMIKVLDN